MLGLEHFRPAEAANGFDFAPAFLTRGRLYLGMLIMMAKVQLQNKAHSCLTAIAVLSLTSGSTMRSTQPERRYTIAVHGGAGVITRDKLTPEKGAPARNGEAARRVSGAERPGCGQDGHGRGGGR